MNESKRKQLEVTVKKFLDDGTLSDMRVGGWLRLELMYRVNEKGEALYWLKAGEHQFDVIIHPTGFAEVKRR